MEPSKKLKPEAIDIQTYGALLKQDLKYLLDYRAENEAAFRQFMEMNPCLVPGSNAQLDFDPSGSDPQRQALIAQPKLHGVISKQPDFMWLSFDSVSFTPVLVKIEAPSRKYFNPDGTPTVDFTRAKNQLDEWRQVLSRPENILAFYDAFNASASLRKMDFKPIYLLVYGRRSEYDNNPLLKNKRFNLVDKNANQYLMSFDRLGDNVFDGNFITAAVKDGKFSAKYLSPTFKIGPDETHLLEIEGLVEAAGRMGYATDDRKAFLKQRIPFWIDKIGSAIPRKKQPGIREIRRPLE